MHDDHERQTSDSPPNSPQPGSAATTGGDTSHGTARDTIARERTGATGVEADTDMAGTDSSGDLEDR